MESKYLGASQRFKPANMDAKNLAKSGSLSLCPPYITRYTMSPLEKINVCGSFIFISYWLISHAILSIN